MHVSVILKKNYDKKEFLSQIKKKKKEQPAYQNYAFLFTWIVEARKQVVDVGRSGQEPGKKSREERIGVFN